MVRRSGTTPSSCCNLRLLTRGFVPGKRAAPEYRHNSANLPPFGSNSLRGFTRPGPWDLRGDDSILGAFEQDGTDLGLFIVSPCHRLEFTHLYLLICLLPRMRFQRLRTTTKLFIISLNRSLFVGFSASHLFPLKQNDILSYINYYHQMTTINSSEVLTKVVIAAPKNA